MFWLPWTVGLHEHVTVIGRDPEANFLIHPLILFPPDVKVTEPAAPTETERVAPTPFESSAGTVNETEIAAPELLVMERDEIAAISFPARSIHRPPAAPDAGEYAKVTDAPAGIALERFKVTTDPEKLVDETDMEAPPSEIE
jgi:hypothetical protein